MTELEYNYDAELGEKKVLDTGSIKYPLKIKCKETGEIIVDTDYTISPRQEEKLENMIENFTKRRALQYEKEEKIDHSNKTISV